MAGRGRLGPRHRQARAQQRVPGAAAAARQDPQRPEGRRRRDARQRRVRLDHPGGRRRHRPHLRPRADALRQDRLDDRRRRRREPHPLPADHAVRPLHATGDRGRSALRRRAAAAPHRGGRRQEPIYTYTEKQMQQTREEARGHRQEGQAADPALQGPRRDGPDQLAETTMHPASRTLRRINLGRRRGGRALARAAHGQRGRPPPRVHHQQRRSRRPRRPSTPKRDTCHASRKRSAPKSTSRRSRARARSSTRRHRRDRVELPRVLLLRHLLPRAARRPRRPEARAPPDPLLDGTTRTSAPTGPT